MKWLILLLLIPGVVAQADLIRSVQTDWTLVPNLDAFEDQPDVSGVCGGGETLTEAAVLRFQETDLNGAGTGCGEALLNLTAPPGSKSISFGFQSERLVTETGLLASPVVFHERVRLHQNGAIGSTWDFEVSADRDHEYQPRQHTFLLEGEAFGLGWYFEDQGYTGGQELPSFGTAQQMEANIKDILIQFPDVTLTPPQTSLQDTRQVNETVTERWHGSFILDGQNATGLTTVTLAPDASLLRLFTAEGDVGFESIPNPIGDQIVFATASGEYEMEIQTTRTVVLPPPTPPNKLTLPILAMLGVPFIGLVAASIGDIRFLRANKKAGRTSYSRFVTPLALATIFLVLAYAGFLTMFFLNDLDELATLPYGIKAYILLIGLGLVFIGGVFIAYLALSTYLPALRQFLQERGLRQDLERSNTELEQFAYIASHDLQEPLRKLIGFSQILDEDYSDKLDEDAVMYLSKIKDSGARMQTLIRDLLAFARVGKDELVPEKVDLNHTMKLVNEDLGSRMAERGATLAIPEMPIVKGDPGQLQQLLQNFVGNAIKYCPPDRNPEVTVTVATEGRFHRIGVQDNGLGIAPEHKAKVFEIFQRLHGKSSKYTGTGIGLAICKRVVENHGGTIGLDSTPGEGSEFWFTLPQ